MMTITLNRPKTVCHARRGFTLIELLVVISIISLLVSILLPALSSARESAKAIQCASNLRQVMVGIYMYANDHDGKPPYSYYTSGATASWPSSVRFRTYAAGLAHTYISDTEVFFCSNQPPAVHAQKAYTKNPNYTRLGAPWVYLAYGGNRMGFMPRGVENFDDRPTIDQILSPSDTIGLAEGRRSGTNELLDSVVGEFRAGSTLLAARHPGQSGNMAYVDGHIERPDPLSLGFDPNAGTLGAWVSGFDRQASPWWEFRWRD